MPTNANTFNSRVTSEALEKKFRDTFPAQGGAELIQDLFASGVIIPTVDFTAAAEGSSLRPDLQQAWDFATSLAVVQNANSALISNPGFWQVNFTYSINSTGGSDEIRMRINTGIATKDIYRVAEETSGASVVNNGSQFVVFLRTGDSLEAQSYSTGATLRVWYRQIADVYGNLTNPLGFTSS